MKPSGLRVVLVSLACAACTFAYPQTPQAKPNIVFILTDDMGYGDPGSFHPASKISTPHIDRLADQGRRFLNAHTSASWCVPSRYGLLTGRYPHRTTWDIDKRSIITPDRLTLARLLRQAGYHTGMVGKWHLGFDSGNAFDCKAPLQGGPLDRGFDYFFGIHASLDIPPYFHIENRQCVAAPTGDIAAGSSPDWSPIQGAYWRAGKIAPGFAHRDVQSTFVRKSVDFLAGHKASRADSPFFLYLALTGPHTPWLPPSPTGGSGGAGLYGDFLTYVDQGIGKVLAALDSLGYAENTLLFLSSDNGPVWYPENTAKYGHAATGPYRGMKQDAWEGGHHVPLIARWPGRIPAGSTSRELVSLTDILATCAAAVDARLPEAGAEDSYNLLPALVGNGPAAPIREALVTSGGSYMTIQKGDWKLITGLGSGGFSSPKTIAPVPGGPQGQLYNLATDPSEQNNLWLQRQDVVASLTALLKKYDEEGRSAPRNPSRVSPAPAPGGIRPGQAAARPCFIPAGTPSLLVQAPAGAARFSLHAPDGRTLGSWAVTGGPHRISLAGIRNPGGLYFQRFRFPGTL